MEKTQSIPGRTLNNISVIIPVYKNDKALDWVLSTYSSYHYQPDEVIVVLDGCESELNFYNYDLPMLNVLQIAKDIPWNQPQAKNIGAQWATVTCKWLFFNDVDHVLDEIFFEEPPPFFGEMIRMLRKIKGTEEYNISPGCFLVRRWAHNKIFGFDERFCGNYGYDDNHYMVKFKKMGYRSGVAVSGIVNPEFGTDVERDTNHNKALYESIKYEVTLAHHNPYDVKSVYLGFKNKKPSPKERAKT